MNRQEIKHIFDHIDVLYYYIIQLEDELAELKGHTLQERFSHRIKEEFQHLYDQKEDLDSTRDIYVPDNKGDHETTTE